MTTRRGRKGAGLVVVIDPPVPAQLADLPTCAADVYLEGEDGTGDEDLVVVNLCRSYQYLSKGYYVSLLAEARHQRIFPSLGTIAAISDPWVYFRLLEDAGLDTIELTALPGRRALPRIIVPDPGTEPGRDPPKAMHAETAPGGVRYAPSPQEYRELTCVLGRTRDAEFQRVSARVFKTCPVPLLRVRMYWDAEEKSWLVGQIFPIPPSQLSPDELTLLKDQLAEGRGLRAAPAASSPVHRIACLFDEHDPFAPSDEATLEKFERAAARQGALFDIIEKDDLPSLAAYDALFIRTVTGVRHYSFAFAQAAERLDIPVIDDPQSIIRCSNKVFLHELFEKHGIPTPPTAIVSRRTPPTEVAALGFPVIVKLPDGTFSQSVKKAETPVAFDALAREMFKKSPLVVVQGFVPTAFDWRIGILDGQLLFAAKYHMAKDHWQIVGRFKTGRTRYGKVEAVALDAVPADVARLALEAAHLVGSGLYGVDVKETSAGPVVIEVNDNPNIMETDEDAVEKDRLYDAIIGSLLRRIREIALDTPAP
jgi:glutathione synthase/RimK-type ligase-like ATP-grasp enzyme